MNERKSKSKSKKKILKKIPKNTICQTANIYQSNQISKRNSCDYQKNNLDVSSIQLAQTISMRKDYRKQYQSVAIFLDDYEKVLDKRIKKLEEKWSSVQILQKNLQVHSQGSQFQQPKKIDNLLQIQNSYYIEKITQLQKTLKDKEETLTQTKKALQFHKHNSAYQQINQQNTFLKEQNALLTRENDVLKRKLKQAGIL